MTDREKAIVMAYTGICMLADDKFQIFHKYVEDIMGRPIMTHEFGNVSIANKIKEKAKADFMALCADQEPKIGWIPVSERLPKKSGDYLCTFGGNNLTGSDYYTTELDAKKIFDDAAEEYVGWRSQNVIAWMPLPHPYDPQESEVRNEHRNS